MCEIDLVESCDRVLIARTEYRKESVMRSKSHGPDLSTPGHSVGDALISLSKNSLMVSSLLSMTRKGTYLKRFGLALITSRK